MVTAAEAPNSTWVGKHETQ